MAEVSNSNSESKDGIVCVTGATGFIASYIIQQLLDAGWTVRATVRSTKDQSKLAYLKNFDKNNRLSFFEANLTEEGSFDEAISGCTYVLHTASPYVLSPQDPQKDLVEPAVFGTTTVMKSAFKSPSVKRIVLTSSVAAITDSPVDGHTYSEEDWNRESNLERNPYYYSKRLAEEAAWNFVKENKCNFDLVVINPYIVIGPELNPFTGINTSNKIFLDMMAGKYPGVMSFNWGLVDVRDVAKSHVLAMTSEKAQGRYLCCNITVPMHEAVELLKEKFPSYKNTLPSANLNHKAGDMIVKMSSYFQDKGTGSYLRTNVGRNFIFDNTKIKRDLAIEFLPVEKSMVDTVTYLIEAGHLPDVREKSSPEDQEKLRELATRMKDPSTGVEVKDRTWMLMSFKSCFVGSEAVDWLMKNANIKHRTEAVHIGRQLVKMGVIQHVVDRHDFADHYYFYKFL